MIKVQTGRGEVTISNAVFTAITGAAATNCFGVKGMAYRSMTDGLVRLLRREAMSKGVKVTYNDDNTVSIELHIVVENGVNIATVCRSIMSEVKYVVTKNTGVEVRDVNVCVDSITVVSAPHRRRNLTMTHTNQRRRLQADDCSSAPPASPSRSRAINDLNVFPVPDGDTGTNMSLTIQTRRHRAAASTQPETHRRGGQDDGVGPAARRARQLRRHPEPAVPRRLQVLQGRCAMRTACSSAAALQEGVDHGLQRGHEARGGHGADRLPSRGRARARGRRQRTTTLEYVLTEAIRVGYETLRQDHRYEPRAQEGGRRATPAARATSSFSRVCSARCRASPFPRSSETETQDKADFAALGEDDITFTFDTVFIVRKTSDRPLDDFRTFLNSIGDSLVIGEDDEAFKVHVHTDIPGEALTEAQKYGTLELAKIENMRTQHDGSRRGAQGAEHRRPRPDRAGA